LQNSPLEGSCVVVALIENYSTSKSLKVSPEKSQILSCDAVVANERNIAMNLRISYRKQSLYRLLGLQQVEAPGISGHLAYEGVSYVKEV
jgi:hypothetical protein